MDDGRLVEARKRIDTATTGHVDLSGLDLTSEDLTELLRDTWAFAEVVSLDLASNELDTLPDAVAAWTSLTLLDLSSNRFSSLPDAVAAWTTLERLILDNNQLTALPNAVAAWTSLSELNLIDNRITALPDAVAAWTAMTKLNLDNNQISALPDAVAAWTALTRLDMDHNQLTALPDAVAAWSCLNVLYLEGNQLTALPDAVAAWTSLSELNLASNKLTALPDAVAAWTSLSGLYLENNQLTALPDAVAAWTALTDLHLDSNQLTALPEAVAAWPFLDVLHLNHNQLTALPDAVAAWTAMTKSNLDNNQISALPDAVAAWTALTRLDMDHNQLTALPDAVAAWSCLNVLYLEGNQLTALPDAVAAWTSLTELHLTGNKLTALPDAVAAWTALTSLYLQNNELTALPDDAASWTSLTELHLEGNQLTALPDAVAAWTALTELNLDSNRLTALPDAVTAWTSLTGLYLAGNRLTALPDAVAAWTSLTGLYLESNQLTTLPHAIGRLAELRTLVVDDNPLPPEVLAAEAEGTEALLAFLRNVAADGIPISEAKLLFVGAGEAGKSSLLGALRGEPWRDRHQTQGMDIKSLVVTHAGREITLNGWDFGGQQAYQPAHQLFFSAPAVYVVVWKPRPGVAAGMVESWIAMIAHRAPDARVLVVASHGGPTSRADAIDERHLKQRFGDLIIGFYEVDSAVPDDRLEALREAISVAAGTLPHVHRNYPASWQRTIEAVTADGQQVIDYRDFEAMAEAQGLTVAQARALASNAHHLGKWIYYADDDALAAFVILQPDWLNVAIAAVLDSRDAVDALGLVSHRMLGSLWGAGQAPDGTLYTREQQRLFLALMGRFELTYQVSLDASPEPVSLIAQLVPAAQPDLRSAWVDFRSGDREYLEVCRISEGPAGPVVIPESLMYRLIVRLHHQRYTEPDSLQGVHWQQGVILQSRYGARALLTVRTGVGVQVQVRGPDAVTYLRQVTDEIRYCIERFWPGLTTVALVACRHGCGLPTPGAGLFDVDKLVKLRDAHGQSVAQCPVSSCDAFPAIDALLGGSHAGHDALAVLQDGMALVDRQVRGLSRRVTELSDTVKANLAGVHARLTALMWQLNDEAADGPRLFTLTPVGASLRNPQWTSIRMRLTLYCEHSLQPVHVLEPSRRDAGVYSIDVSREWWVRAVPLLKATSMLLKPLLGVGVAELKLEFSDEQWKAVEEQVSLANETLNAAAEAADHLTADDHSAGLAERAPGAPPVPVIAEGATLRTLHAALRAQDVTIADLRKVVRPDGRILWVHRQFEHLYHGGLPVIP
ncbi:COR domain-containing protein [Micromonospora sp. NPDC049662]|uniref:leucine-rich repeat domain-containing protein n=1 Tax=Micromonospora sp. NPDC049662 TaxID=3155397 RepID=UPI0034183662